MSEKKPTKQDATDKEAAQEAIEHADKASDAIASAKKLLQKPAIGRVLHYHPSHDEITNEPQMANKGQPYAATTTHVWGGDAVNIRIDQDGSFPVPSERLVKTSVLITDEPKPGCCTWPARV